MKKLIFVFSFLFCTFLNYAQTSADTAKDNENGSEKLAALQGKVDGLEESYLADKATVAKLAKLKMSGYMQIQYRMATDTAGTMDATGKYLQKVGDFAGGALTDGTRGLVQVRRGRLKLGYETELTQSYIQFDASTGGFEIKDVYFAVTEPWLKSVGLKGGIFDRPFGYEISYSSSNRESPERSRLFQVLFPKERDLGAMLFVNPAEKLGMLSHFNLKAGLFNGTQATLAENDNKKDFIGRLGFSLPLTDINLSIDGGVSAYMGSVTCTDTTYSSWTTSRSIYQKHDTVFVGYVPNGTHDTIINGTKTVKSIDSGWAVKTTTTVATKGYQYEMSNNAFIKNDSAAGQLNKQFDRKYFGGDLQVCYDLPVLGGLKLNFEYIQGVQPGTSSSSSYYNPGRNSTTAVYMRNFMGYYLMYVQNVFKSNQLVLKYDVYDPNTDVEGKDFTWDAAAKKVKGGLSGADLKYSTVGLGWIYHWDENLKFVLYYDMVANETADAYNNSSSTADKLLAKDFNDNVLTVRAQYKF